MNDTTTTDQLDFLDHGAHKCKGGGEAHEAHMDMNGDCPWCGSYDKSKWL